MARGAKRAKTGGGPAVMGAVRSNILGRDIQSKQLLSQLVPPPEYITGFEKTHTVDWDSKGAPEQWGTAILNILHSDFINPGAHTVVKLRQLLEMCEGVDPGVHRASFIQSKRGLRALSQGMYDMYMYENSKQDLYIYLYHGLSSILEGLGLEPRIG